MGITPLDETPLSTVELPVVSEDNTIEQALEQLYAADKRALVVEHRGNRFRLYTNSELLEASLHRTLSCRDLRGGREVLLVKGPASRAHLDAHLAGYAMRADVTVGIQSITTRYERFAAAIVSGTKICRCEPGHTHIEEWKPGLDGATCPSRDGSVFKCY